VNQKVLGGLLVLAGLTSCVEPAVFHADVPVPEGRWDRTFKPSFSFEITDTVNKHDVFIDLRHTGEYPFSDLFLFVELAGPGGRAARDTVECILADPSGQWFGKGLGSIFADRYRPKVLYKLGNRFPANGRYSITLEQAMRTEQLQGLLDVGISIERSKR